MKKIFFAFGVLALVGQGCPISPRPSPPTEPKTTPVIENRPIETDAKIQQPSSTTTQEASTFVPFSKSAYEAAVAAHKPIFLFFYANWCPTCREQEPRLQRIVPTHTGGVVGFRVNYNDTDTDEDEKALAREFGVTYQHTGFFIGTDGEVKKKTIGTFSDAQTLEYLNLITP